MKELIVDYWNKIAKSPLYWIPMLVFSILGYGFSICSRTIHRDDLLKDHYNEVLLYSDRWGMLVWSKLIGVTDLFPFVDRFVTVLFLLIASFLISSLFFLLSNRNRSVIPFTVLSSMLLTYPLVGEVFEYTGADVQYAGNLALMIFAFIYMTLKRKESTVRVIFIASFIMVLPASSYETGLFSYITLLCAAILYKYLKLQDSHLCFKEWLIENGYYLSPVLLAVAFRFIVHFFILFISGTSHVQIGGTEIEYEHLTLAYLFGSNVFKYYVAGLVYFPITVFVVFSICYVKLFLQRSIANHDYKVVFLAVVMYVSVFSLAFIRGLCMDYRIAQTVTIFVAFVAFLLCELYQSRLRLIIPSALLFLCWHQAVYLNNILSLNNMRSNNEIISLQYIGNRVISEFDNKKPVVFISEQDPYGGYLGPWIEKRAYADKNSWNGRLFENLVNKYLPEKYRHYKYINSNINNILNWTDINQIKSFFSYCGYDISIVSFSSILNSEDDPVERKRLVVEYETASTTMNPLEIRDIGKCLLVKYWK